MRALRILYRADGGRSVGTGHILRAKRLLAALADAAETDAVLALADDPIGLRLADGTPAHVVTTGPLHSAHGKPVFDPASLAPVVAQRQFDVIAVDMLDTPEGSLSSLRRFARRVITFDDRGAGRLGADAIVNVLVREPQPASLASGTLLAEGPEYATLDPVYATPTPVRDIKPSHLNALVTLGGADSAGLTLKVLRALLDVDGLAVVSVVCGIGSGWREQALDIAQGAPWRLNLHDQVPNLRDLFLSADLAFVAGGLTMHEACCTGTPSIAVCQPIDHQPELARWFAERGAMLTVGDGAQAEEREIADAARGLVADAARRASMSAVGRRLVDGRGTQRTARLILRVAGVKVEETDP